MSRVSDATRLFISRNYVLTSKNSGFYARIFACVANLIFAKQCICSTIEDNKVGQLQEFACIQANSFSHLRKHIAIILEVWTT